MKTTLYKAKKVKRKRKHGFLQRSLSASGRWVITKRRRKGRSRITV